MVSCEHCGRETPDEPFCTRCGAQRTAGIANPRWRRHHYAAHPGEHVAQPRVISTLLPHLPSHRHHEFRWGLLVGLAAVVALVAAGQVVAGIFTAAVLVPVLYLVYLYEAQVYREEPARVIGLTIVAGAAIGVVVLVVANSVISSSSPLEVGGATGAIIAGTVLLPLVEEVVKPLPVFLLRRRAAFRETVDGLVFGIAAGLGFAAAETIYDFSHVIGFEHLNTSSGTWLFPVLSAAVTTPLMQASCTGAITASLWRRGRSGSRLLYALGVPVALAGHIGFTLVSWVIAHHGASQLTVLIWQAAVVAALLVYIRFLLHQALIDEAEDFGLHTALCPHCRRQVEGAAFCPHCGAALAASPRTGHGRLTSESPGPVAEPDAADT
jgi:RsiW-degrading membrane proteinase PrsW (M82 family)